MITQKPIALKIDTYTLEVLDTEVSLGWRKRNWHINQAIRVYLSLQDARRLFKCVGSDDNKKKVLNDWLREQFPEAAQW